MKGFPKTVRTGQDLFNCLALVQAGQLPAKDLSAAIAGIEARAFIPCPVRELSENRKNVTVIYCVEAQTGQTVGNGTGNKITAVEHLPDESGGNTGGGDSPGMTRITLSKPLSAGEAVLFISAPINPLAEIGVTSEELNSIKVVLKQYA